MRIEEKGLVKSMKRVERWEGEKIIYEKLKRMAKLGTTREPDTTQREINRLWVEV